MGGCVCMQHTVKKMKLILLALVLLSVIIITAANYRMKYCYKKEYIPRGDRYPHLHCGSNFFVLSRGKHNHTDFVIKETGKALCDKVEMVLADPVTYYNYFPEITIVLQHFKLEECPERCPSNDNESQKDKESTKSPKSREGSQKAEL